MKIRELENRLRVHAEIVKANMVVPFDLKGELKNMEEKSMEKPKDKIWIRKTLLVAAGLVLCMVTAIVTPMANSVKGFFKDITRIGGAITGTAYVNATSDIEMTALETNAENGKMILPLDITFKNKTEAPFPYIQEIAITDYQILNSSNKKILHCKNTLEESAKGTVIDGKVSVNIPIDEMLNKEETYIIQIETMYGLSKADAPLEIKGHWECAFKR